MLGLSKGGRAVVDDAECPHGPRSSRAQARSTHHPMIRVAEGALLALSTLFAYLTVRDARASRRESIFGDWMRDSTSRIERVADSIIGLAEARSDEHRFRVARLRYMYALHTAMNPQMEYVVLFDLETASRAELSDEMLEAALHEVDEWLLNTPSRSADMFFARRRRTS
jgi:hypothetical protein